MSNWWKHALLKTAAGLVLGAIVSVAVVATGTVFPEIKDAGIDAGMRLRVHLQRMAFISTGLPVREPGFEVPNGASAGFVFVDLDPDRTDAVGTSNGGEPESGCAAMAAKFPNRYRLAGVGDAPPTTGRPALPKPLHCQSTRPVNRYLLARVVEALRVHKPRVIVVDIVLGEDDDIVPGDETEELVDGWSRRLPTHDGGPGDVPIVYAAPVQLVWNEHEPAARRSVVTHERPPVSGKAELESRLKAFAQPAVAFPEPGQPVRRFANCFVVADRDAPLSTLPRLVADLMSRGSPPEPGDCATANARRIVFTVPPLNVHQAETLQSSARDDWSFYRRVFNHCLVAQFWGTAPSPCSSEFTPQSAYSGRIVVVGASNPIRRDWHYTPLGNMVGAEVVINAIRSFTQFPNARDKSGLESLFSKWLIVLVCGVVWGVFFAYWMRARYAAGLSPDTRDRARADAGTEGRACSGAVQVRSAPLRYRISITFWFLVTLLVVLVTTVWMSFRLTGPAPSLDVLAGVLAITLEQYVEGTRWLLHRLEAGLGKLLHIHPRGIHD